MASYVGIPNGNPTKYLGPNVSILSIVTRNRAPTGADIRQGTTGQYYPIGSYWIVSKDPTTGTVGDLWYLSNIVANVASWIKLSTGSSGPTLGFIPTTGTSPVFPNGNGLVNFTSASGALVITGSTNTLDFSLAGGGIAIEKFAVPHGTTPVVPTALGLITITEGPGIVVTGGLNTYSIGLAGGGIAAQSFTVDAHTGPGTNPVVPSATGGMTVTGGQVAAGTTTNVIRTDSLAANTFTVEVQRSQATGSSTVGDNGVCHFDSSVFSVDANAFVGLAAGFYTNGTFTPILTFGGASTGITYTTQYGEYTKIGNVVHFVTSIILTSKGSATGNAEINGLPIAVATGNNNTIYAAFVTYDAGYAGLYGFIETGTTKILMLEQGSAVVNQILTDANFANNSIFNITGFYFTS